jgi:hypothetical protein
MGVTIHTKMENFEYFSKFAGVEWNHRVQHAARLEYALSRLSLPLPHSMPCPSTIIPVNIPVHVDIMWILEKYGEINWSAFSSPRLGSQYLLLQ